jgi:Holliday junction resolvase
MTEQQIQTKIKKKLQAQGYFVTKLIKTSTNGIPDLLAIKDGQATFIEVKKENGILSPLQELRLSELAKYGCIVKVWSDFETNF